MCRYFNDHNIPSMCLTGQSSDEERAAAKRRLVSGEVRFIFVVDIYNEGVDIPDQSICKASRGRFPPRDAEQGGQGLFANHHVQRLFHQ